MRWLSLGELRSATGSLEAVFLTLFHTRIAGEEAGFFQNGAQLLVVLQQCSGNAVTDSTGLSGDAAAANVADNVKVAVGVGQLQGLADNEF